MPPPFEQLATQKGLAFVNGDIAFRGDFADWMTHEIKTGDPQVFVANLAPIRLHDPKRFFNSNSCQTT